ncbi:hypothetical protein OG474_38660 [Kribbella sp. NBC_01505]|uniref:hypothetical protein n=1 Tax=Kribbella sp. NBC_01505 TaxID=2903580 RepID=UPI00386DDF23
MGDDVARQDVLELGARLGKEASSASLPVAAPNSVTFSSPIPASQPSPSASYGATPAMTAAARHRSGSKAAQASAVRHPTIQG